MDKYLSDKIKVLSFVLIILVVFLHSYNLSKNTIDSFDLNHFIQNFISNGVSRIAVPLFFLISGYLFFKDKPCSVLDFKNKFKKRFYSLVIPFVFWSSLGILTFFLLQLIPNLTKFFTNKLIISFNYIDFLNTLVINPIPFQLWFIRDLIVLILISPLLNFILKKFNLFFICSIFILWFIIPTFYIFTSESMLFFSIGASFSIRYQLITTFQIQNKYIKYMVYFYLILLIVKTTFLLSFTFNMVNLLLCKISILIGVATIWFLYDLYIYKNRNLIKFIIPYTTYTFFIFAAHEPMLTMIKKGLIYLTTQNSDSSLFIYLISPFLAIVFCFLIGFISRKYFTKFHTFITGGR